MVFHRKPIVSKLTQGKTNDAYRGKLESIGIFRSSWSTIQDINVSIKHKNLHTFQITDAANNSGVTSLVAHTEFYNSTLDHIDLMKEYATWQNPERAGTYISRLLSLSLFFNRF